MPVPSARDFYLEVPLYDKIEYTAAEFTSVRDIIWPFDTIDGHCPTASRPRPLRLRRGEWCATSAINRTTPHDHCAILLGHVLARSIT